MKWATRRSCRTQVVPVSVHHGGRPHHRTQAPGQPPSPPSTGRPGMTSGSAMVPLPPTAARPDGTNQRRACPRFPSNSAAGGQDRSRGMELRCGRREGLWDSSSPSHLDTFIRRPVPDSSQSPSVSGAGCEADGTLKTLPVLLVSQLRHFPSHFHRHLPESPSLSPELPLFASPHHGTPMSPGAA